MSKVKQSKQTSRKGNSRSNTKMPRGDKFDAKTATNNPAWYATDPALLRDAASIPFSWALGTPINLDNQALAEYSDSQEFTIPGVCALYCIPSIGRAETSADPINTAAFRAYSFVRHNNSGHANYDSTDLMLYLLSMSQAYSYLNFLQRVYGICTTYAQKNRYLPDVLLYKMGIDPVSVRNNLAGFRYGINALINKIASMNVPATMSIFARHASIYQNLYIEGPSIKNQLYFYTPQGFWKYTLDEANDFAGKLEYSQFVKSTPWDVDGLLEYGNDMIARLIQSEDMNIMSGDILKAYGDGALIKLSNLPEVYPIIPLPDLAVLQQMKNATIVPVSMHSRDVVHDSTKGWLQYMPEAYSKDNPVYVETEDCTAVSKIWRTFCEKRVLTVASPEPTPEEIMESTRCMNILKFDEESGDESYYDVYPGSEIITAIRYSFNTSDQGWVDEDYAGPNYVVPIKLDWNVSTENSLWIQSVLSNFKFHPAHHFVGWKYDDEGNLQLTQSFLNFDVDNYAIIDFEVLRRMHEAALLSMLNVPSIVRV